MARNDKDLTPVTGSVSPELRKVIEDHRWTAHKTVSDVVREALTEWADKRGLTPVSDPQTDPETASDTSPEAETASDPEPEAAPAIPAARRR